MSKISYNPRAAFLLATMALWQIGQPLQAATNTWLGVTADWTDGANWSSTLAPIATDDLIFGAGTPGTITVGLNSLANGLSFFNNYALSTNNLTLTSGAIRVGVGYQSTLNSILSGTAGLTLTGGGSVRLTNNANDYTGTTTVGNGALIITNGSQLGGSATTVTVTGSATRGFGGGTLVLDGSSAGFTLARNLSLQGLGPVTPVGAALISSGDNALSGTVNMGVGSINTRAISTAGLLTLLGGLDVAGTAATTISTLGGINQTAGGNYSLTGALTGTGTLEKSGTGTLFLTPSASSGFAGTIRVSGSATGNQSSVRITSAGVLGTRVATGTGAVLDLNTGGILEVRMDAPSLLAGGSAANVYQRNNSALFVDNGTGVAAVNGTATFGQLAFEENFTLTLGSRNGYNISFSDAPVQGGNNNSTITNNLAGELRFTGALWSNTEDTASRTLTFGGNGNTLVTGALTASSVAFNHNLAKTGTGVLTINNNLSTLDGTVAVQGSLAIRDFRSIGAATNAETITLGNATTTGGNLIIGTAAAPTAANLASARPIILNTTSGANSIYASQAGATGVTLTGTITKPNGTSGALILGGSNTADNTVNTVIPVEAVAGTGGVTKLGSGTWVLAAANTYLGATTIANGTLKLSANAGASTVIPETATNTIVFNADATTQSAAGRLEFTGFLSTVTAETLGALTPTAGAGNIIATANGAATTLTFSSLGTRGAGASINYAPGASANIAFTALPVVTNGIIAAATGGAAFQTFNGVDWAQLTGSNVAQYLGYTVDTLPASGVVDVNVNHSLTTNALTSGAASINTLKLVGGAGNPTVTLGGILTLTAKGLLFDNSAGTGAITGSQLGAVAVETVIITSGTTPANALTVDSLIGGTTGALTKSGTGTLIVGGNNTYTGVNIINEGKVKLAGASATLGVNSTAANTLTVRQGATLDINAETGRTILNTGALIGAGTITNSGIAGTVSFGRSTSTGATAFSGIIEDGTGQLNVTVDGTSARTQSFLGQSTYTGSTTINTGAALTVNTLADGGSPSGIGSSTNGAANLVFNGATPTLVYQGNIRSGSLNLGATSATTNRLFTISGSGAVLSSTAANNNAIVWSNTGAIVHGTDANRTLTLTGTSTGDNTLVPQITNSTGFVTSVSKTGVGIWHLGAASNTYSGATTLTGGILGATDGQGLPATSNLVFDGGTLYSQGAFVRNIGTAAGEMQFLAPAANTAQFSGGFVGGDSKLTVSWTGTPVWDTTAGFLSERDGFILNGSQARAQGATGSIALSEVDVSGNFSLGTAAGTAKAISVTTAANSANVTVTTGDTSGLVVGQTLVGPGFAAGAYITSINSLTTFTMSANTPAAQTAAAGHTVEANTLRPILVNDNANTGADFATISGVISGGDLVTGIRKLGTGTLKLTGANTYSGETNVNQGTLVVKSLGQSGSAGATSVGDQNTANIDASAVTLGNGSTGAGILQYIGAGETSDRKIRLNTTTGTTQIHADGTGPLVLSNVLNDMVAGAKILSLRGSNTGANTISSQLSDNSGALGVTVDGGATWILSNATNNYTGTTTVGGGALGIANNTALGDGTLLLGNGTVFAYQGDRAPDNVINQANNTTTAFIGDYSLSLGPVVNLAIANNWGTTNNIVSGKTLTLGGIQSDLLPANRNWTVDGAGTTIVSGTIASTTLFGTGIVKTGTGLLRLDGTGGNFTQGGANIDVDNGTLRMGANTAIPSGVGNGGLIFSPEIATLDTATFDLNGTSQTVNALTAAAAATGTVTIDNTAAGAASLTFGAGDAAVAFGTGAGTYSITDSGLGALSITKTGTGTALIGGTAVLTYEGATTVEAGTLNIASAFNSSTSLQVNGGATLNLFGNSANAPAGIATLNLGSGAGTVTLGLELGANTANSDRLAIAGAATTANNVSINIAALAGFGGSPTYDLISAGSGLSGATWGLGYAPGGYTYSLSASDTLVQLNTAAVAAGDMFWLGGLGTQWGSLNGSVSNWVTDIAGNFNANASPGALTTVNFSSTAAVGPAISTSLEIPYAVNALKFLAAPAGVTSVTIAPGVSGTLSLAPAVSTDGIDVADNAGAVTVSAPVSLGANQTWTVAGTGANGSSLTVSGGIIGTGNLVKTGAGVLTVSGSGLSTYNGSTTVSGELRAGSTNAFSAASSYHLTATGLLSLNGFSNVIGSLGGVSGSVVQNGGATAFTLTTGDNGASTVFDGIIQNGSTGTLALTKNGAGTQTLGGANTYTGGTIINAGEIRSGATGVLPDTGTITLRGPGVSTLNLNDFNDTIAALTLGGTGGAAGSVFSVATGAGTLTLGGTLTYTATGNPTTAAVINGNLSVGGATRTVAVADSTGTDVDLSIPAIISSAGAFGITKTGVGVLQLSGANTYTGTTTISVGEIRLGANNALPDAGAITLLNITTATPTSILNLNGFNDTIGALTFGGTGGLAGSIYQVNTGSGTLTLGGTVTTTATGNYTTSPVITGKVDLGAADRTFSVADSTGTLVDLNVPAVISGAAGVALVKTGAGTMRVSGLNTFAGGVNVTLGILDYSTVSGNGGSASSLGQGTDGITLNGGTLNFIGSTSQTTNRAMTLTAASTLGANGTSGAVISYTGGLSMAGTTLDWTMSGAGEMTLSGTPWAVADDFTLTGSGTTVLNLNTTGVYATNGGANGDARMNIRNGTLRFGADNPIVANVATGVGRILLGDGTTAGTGTLNMNGFDQTISTLDLGAAATGFDGVINGGAGSLLTVNTSININRGTIAADVTMAGAPAITKTGLGLVTLSGDGSALLGTALRLDAGNTVLDHTTTAANKIGSTYALDMRGGELTLLGSGSAPTSQTVASFTLANGGANTITVTSGAGQTATLNLGAITRAASAGTVRINLPASGAVTTTSPNNSVTGLLGTGATAVTTSSAYATVKDGSGTWFASRDGSNNIVGLVSTVKNDVTTWVAGDHVTNDGFGFTGLLGSLTVNSLRYNAAGGSTVNVGASDLFRIASGGILITDQVTGVVGLVGGRIGSGTNELVITHDGAGLFTLASDVRAAITKTGNGSLLLSGNNNFTGQTLIQGGTVSVTGGSAIPDNSLVTLADDRASTLKLLANETIGRLAGGSAADGLRSLATVDIGNHVLTTNTTAANTTYAGLLVGTGTLIKNGFGTNTNWSVTNSNTGFTGSAVVNEGVMILSGIGRLDASNFTVNKNAGILIDNNGATTVGTRILDTATISLNSADGAASGSTVPSGLWIRRDQGSTQSETVGAITASSGASYVRAETTAASAIAILTANNLLRSNNATMSVRGNDMALTTGRRSQFRLAAANEAAFISTLVGGAGAAGTASVSILPWMIAQDDGVGAIGDANMGNSLATYTPTTGFRPLNFATEYATYGTATASNNVREALTGNLALDSRTINSLVLHNATAGTDSFNVSGPGAASALTVNSGTFLFTLNPTAAASGANGISLGGFDNGITIGAANEYVFFVQNPSSATTTPTLTATISSPLDSNADITKSGRGTLVLTGIPGGVAGGGLRKTTINEGILEIANLNNIGGLTGGLVFAGGTLRLGSAFDVSNRTISFLQGGGTIDTNGFDVPLANGLGSGVGGFTKTGAGVLTLMGNASYTGTTTVSGGTLALESSNSGGGGTVINGGTLTLKSNSNGGLASGLLSLNSGFLQALGAPRSFSNEALLTAITVNGDQNLTFAGTLTGLNGANRTLTNAMTAGTLTFGSVQLNNDTGTTRTFTLAGTGNTLFGGVISNGNGDAIAQNLTVTSAGVTTFTGANTYTGTTVLNNTLGSLILEGAGRVNGPLTINAGSVDLLASGTNQTTGVLTMGGGTGNADPLLNSSASFDIGLGRVLSPSAITYSATNNNLTAVIGGAGTLNLGTAGYTVTVGNSTAVDIDMSWEMNTLTGDGVLTKTGLGTLDIRGITNNNFLGSYLVTQGAVLGLEGLGNNFTLNGGVFESNGSFTRALGTGFNEFQWAPGANGGFAANGAPFVVNIGAGSPDPLVWGVTSPASGTPLFVSADPLLPAAGQLLFGSSTADNVVTLQNNIDLNGANRTIQVIDNTLVATDKAVITGVLSNGSLTKSGTGVLELPNANPYAGGTSLGGGTLIIGNKLSLGAGPVTVTAASTLQPTLLLTGTDKFMNPVTMNANLTLASAQSFEFGPALTGNGADVNRVLTNSIAGPGKLIINDLLLAPAGTTNTAARTFTITGTGETEILGAISNGNAFANALTISSTGPTTLKGVNTYTGATTLGTTAINAGTLTVAAGSNVGTGTLTIVSGTVDLQNGGQTMGALTMGNGPLGSNAVFQINGGNVTLGGNITYTASATSGTATVTAGTLNLGAARTFTINDSSQTNEEMIVQAVIAGPAFGITKAGTGTLVLSGASTYTGATTINAGLVKLTGSIASAGTTTLNNAGQLLLDFTSGTDFKLNNTSTMTMTGGILRMLGNASAPPTLQGMGTLNVNAGAASIIVESGAVGVPAAFTSNTIVKGVGGTVDFSFLSVDTGFETGAPNGSGNLLGGYATINKNRFATVNGGKLEAFNSTVLDTIADWTAGADVTDSTGYTGTLAASLDINSLRFAAAGVPSTVTIGNGSVLRVSSGGILVTPAVGTGTASITGGVLAGLGGAGNELMVHQHNTTAAFSINSSLTGATILTKSGEGILTLGGVNTYTGNTYINQGTLRLNSNTGLSPASQLIFKDVAGVTLDLANHTATTPTLNGGTNVTVATGTGKLTINGTAAGTFTGAFTGAGELIKSGTSTLTVNGTSTGFTGALRIDQGQITLDGNLANFANLSSVTLNGAGTLRLNYSNNVGGDRISNAATVTLNNTIIAAGGGLRINNTDDLDRAETMGPLTLGAGHNSLWADGTNVTASFLTTMTFASLNANNRATSLVVGRNLGAAAGTRSRIIFTAAPTAIGGAGAAGTTSISIIPNLIGESTAGVPAATNVGNSFVSIGDGTNGVRPLDLTTEYVVDQTNYDALGAGLLNNNVRFTATTTPLASDTTGINSLVIDNAVAAVVEGPAQNLRITAGAILSAGAGANEVKGFTGLSTTAANYYAYVTNAAGSLTLTSPLTSAAPLVKSGAGTLILGSAGNAFTDLYLNHGAIQVDATSKLGSGALNFFGGTLRFGAAFDPSSKTMAFGTGGGTFDTNGFDISFANGVGGASSGGLTKSGVGTLTLNGANTYTGVTTVSSGALFISNSLASSAVSVGAAATFGGVGTLAGDVNLTGTSGNEANLTPGIASITSGAEVLEIQGSLTLGANSMVNFFLNQANFTALEMDTIAFVDTTAFFNITLASGYTPVAGSSFNLMDWTNGPLAGDIDWADNLLLPTISGLAWDTSDFSTLGILRVTGAATAPNVVLPTTSTVNAGDPLTLTASVSGSQVYLIQWKKDGTAIPDAKDLTYTIASTVAGDAGVYTIEVSNEIATVTKDITVSVRTAPEIVGEPVNRLATVNTTFQMSVGTVGPNPKSFAWTQNGAAITEANVTGGATATLNFQSVQLANAGTYQAAVENSFNTGTPVLSAAADVVVISQPQFTPVAEGNFATFSVSAAGKATLLSGLTYKWLRNGAEINDTAEFLGTNTPTLQVLASKTTQANNFSVRVSGFTATAVTTNAVPLTIAPGTIGFVGTLQPQILPTGSDFTLSLGVIGGKPQTLKWLKAGKAVSGTNVFNTATNTLYVLGATVTNAGVYSLEASNKLTTGPSDKKVSPTVADIVIVDTTPKRFVIKTLAASPTMTVSVGGLLNATTGYQWLKSADNGLTFTLPVGTNSKTFKDPAILAPGRHLYRCRITAASGGVLDAGINEVLVNSGAPVITETPSPAGSLPTTWVGETYDYQVKMKEIVGQPGVVDPTLTATKFVASGLPPGLKIDVTGRITGKATAARFVKNPTTLLLELKPYSVKITASNAFLPASVVTLDLLVNDIDPRIVGNFTGPIDRHPLNGNLGGFINLTSTKTGSYTVKVIMGAVTYSGKGVLGITGTTTTEPLTTVRVSRGKLTPMDVTFKLKASDGTIDYATTSITTADYAGPPTRFNGWLNQWARLKTKDEPTPAEEFAGVYNLGLNLPSGLQGTIANPNIPQGTGYAAFTVSGSTGGLTVAGKLSDGTAFTTATYVGPAGQVAVFKTLYSTKALGSVLGSLRIDKKVPGNYFDNMLALDEDVDPGLDADTDNDPLSLVSWFKPAQAGRAYADGFGPLMMTAFGGQYIAPLTGNRVMGLTDADQTAVVELVEANVESATPLMTGVIPETIALAVSTANKATMDLNNPRKVSLTITPKTGAITGKFTLVANAHPFPNPAKPATVTRAVTYYGLIVKYGPLLTDAMGVGYFLLPQLPATTLEKTTTTKILSGEASFFNP